QSADNKVSKLHVKAASQQKPVIATSTRAQLDNSLNQILANLPDHEIITLGSSLKSCLVAEGKADIYPKLGPTSEWDTAAAQCILEEAGGQMLDLNLEPLRYNTKDSLLNPHFLAFGDESVNWLNFI
ncbi:MAG: inositol monophosphatase family protein, partial [Gammaproteobacteria bacterium]|nr:inositol monophosphatase family protein [Gammaproteobacteria bacterium]